MTTGETPTPFTGFPEEALAFYEGLEADNSRTYWNDHRDVYENAVKAPMLAMLAALEAEFGVAKLFRPYRDVRFSKDKSPYKTACGAVLHHTDGEGSLYVQFSAEGLMTGGGYYQVAPDQLQRYRAAVEDDASGASLVAVVQAMRDAGYDVGAAESLKRVPRGIDPDHPRADLLRLKGLAAFRTHGTPDWLATAGTLDVVARDWRGMAALNSWLLTHVGPAEQTEGDPRPTRGTRRVSPGRAAEQ